MVRKRHKFFSHFMPVTVAATGILYTAIGVIAILSYLRLQPGGINRISLSDLSDIPGKYPPGMIVLIFIFTLSLVYILWRLYESYTDQNLFGTTAGGLARRTGIALNAIADILIVFAALRFLFEPGNQPFETLSDQGNIAVDLLHSFNGPALVILAGILVGITAVIQLIYGFTGSEWTGIGEMNPYMRIIVKFFGLTGYLARSMLLGTICYFYIHAGLDGDTRFVVDTDRVFAFINDKIGNIYFVLVALGTSFYGLFMLAIGSVYHYKRKRVQ